MKTFLEHVARDILTKYGTDLSRVAVVFPGKRASLFLNDALARLSGQPLWSPAYTTISDLIRSHTQRQVADPIKLVCDLHRSFTTVTGTDETLDHFYSWGQLLLADFDDIDKQMVDADRVFSHVANLHEMDDDSYLTPEQRQAIRRFFSTFSDENNSQLRQRFLRLWSHLADIYHDFNQRLAQQGLAYEGALYREVAAGAASLQLEHDVYLFVGFNLLVQAERRLFTELHRQGRARFYWDYDHSYLHHHEAGQYICQHLDIYPNELPGDDDGIFNCAAQPKRISLISATTENIQARYATQWLRSTHHSPLTTHHSTPDTAIVLADEGLLSTLIHCLPEEVGSVNITTGYPLVQTPIASLISLLLALRRDGYDQQRQRFRPRQLRALMRHPYVRALSPAIDELLTRPFGPTHQNTEVLRWLCDVVEHVAKSLTTHPSPLTTESAFRAYTLLNRLLGLAQAGDLVTDMVTLSRLIQQLMQQTSIPFHGEPAEGLQVMGMLETRNLDFRHLLILSASEGNLPSGLSDTSFIPYTLRRAYGLTTPDHKAALSAYYFYRLLQRAEDVTIVYNNATTDGQKGQMSRFLLQLMAESPHPISKYTLRGSQTVSPRRPAAVDNHAQPPQLLTPTAINRYLRCPLQFHYHYVMGLREPDEPDDETIDNRIFGNIFHEAARIIYTRLMGQSNRIMAADIDRLLRQRADIERAVDEAFRQELPPGMARQGGLHIINRQVIIHYLRQLLEIDRRLAPFTILSLEGDVSMDLPNFQSSKLNVQSSTLRIGGRIDRLDLVTDSGGRERIRVIDYKTGAHRLRALADVDAIFSQDSLKDHSDYYLQTFLYALIVVHDHPETPVSPALLFIQHAAADDYDPTLCLGKQPVTDVSVHGEAFMRQLGDVVSRMFDPSAPLTPTDDLQRCRTCPYRQLCY